MKILFIDSGIGGISTLATTCKMLPKLNFIYYADDKFAPYGAKSKRFLQKHLYHIINSFLGKDICAVVLACNTATTNSIEFLRKHLPVKIIGTEPAIKLAANNHKNVLLVATPLTTKSKRLKTLAKGINIKLSALALPNLARAIDNYYLHSKQSSLLQISKNISKIQNKAKNNSCIVLGCTHYCFLSEQIHNTTHLQVIDGNLGVAKQIAKYSDSCLSNHPIRQFILSSGNINLQKKYTKIFEQTLAKYTDV